MTPLHERAKALFNTKDIPESLNEANQQKYIAAMEWLGDKHILATQITRKDNK